MAAILIATHAGKSHISPLAAAVRELTARGHRVRWYTAERYRHHVEATGATFVGPRRGRFVDFETMERDHPEITRMSPRARQAWFLDTAWAGTCNGQYHDLAAEVTGDDAAEILLADAGMWAANLVHEVHDTVWATISQAPLSLHDPALPPYGRGWHPAGPGSRRRDDIAGLNMLREAMGPSMARLNRIRAELGLPATRGAKPTPYLLMQATTPSFEYPRATLPAHAHFVGPLLPAGTADPALPEWFGELDGFRPVVLVTQGTMANRADQLILPAVRALAEGPEQVVVTTGQSGVHNVPGMDRLPGNVRVAGFLPYDRLLPKVDAVVCNGGYGTVHQALAHGIPLVAAGRTEDKPETCARISWCGAGIDLRTGSPEPARIRAAADAVCHEPWFRAGARRMRDEFARHDAPHRIADLLDRLAVERAPITAAVDAELPTGRSTAPADGAR